jgi:hypothetical protein
MFADLHVDALRMGEQLEAIVASDGDQSDLRRLRRCAAPGRSGPTLRRGSARPALSFRSEGVEARTALHQEHSEDILELFDPSRQGWLGDPTSLGGFPEMLLLRQRDEKV